MRSGKSDPYVVMEVDGVEVGRTRVIKRTLDPEWNHTYDTVDVKAEQPKQARLIIFDSDKLTKDDNMGEVSRLMITNPSCP